MNLRPREKHESGDKWLGALPVRWRARRARHLGIFTGSGIDKKDNDGEVPVKMINYTDVYKSLSKVLRYSDSLMSTTATPSKVVEHAVREGDILLTPSSETADDIGHAALVASMPEGVVYSYHILRYRLTADSNARYLTYCFNAHPTRAYFSSVCTGTTRMVLGRDDFKDAPIALPSLDEQTTIANFLDRETQKIDELIEKQERLIALLEEKRQAVISHAVTKGLNPDVWMKESGVEWLGEVPEHWTVKNYRYSTTIFRGKFGHRPRNDPAFYDGEFPFIQTGDIARAGVRIESYKQTLNAKGRSVSEEFPAGTLVMAIAANVGDVAILDFNACCPDSVVGFKPREDVLLEFLRYSFMASIQGLISRATVSTQLNLNIERIGGLEAVFPTPEEQSMIVSFLDAQTVSFKKLTAKAQDAVTLLQERRTALISAAVTGKIDVRGLA